MWNSRSKRILGMALSQEVEEVSMSSNDSEEVISDTDSDYLPSESSRGSLDMLDGPGSHTVSLRGNIEKDVNITPPDYKDNMDMNNEGDVETLYPVSKEQNLNTTNVLSVRAQTHIEIKNLPVERKRIRRKHHCFYCYQEVGNFSRHLERNHSDEIEVQKFMSLEKKQKNRKKIIDKLRREGDFSTTNIVPVMKIKESHRKNYICCKFCRGYYASKSLRRHVKKCFFNPDPSKRCNAQTEGQTLMVGPFGPNDPLKVSGLLNMMRADEVSMVARKDEVICEVARRYIKSHREKHLLSVAKRYMRRLARLVISARKISEFQTIKLISLLDPSKFKVLVKATKVIAEYDEKERVFKSPSLGLQMGTLIKHAINAAVSIETQREDSSKERLEKLKSLTTLIETDWALEVSSEAGQNLVINKFNKPSVIPVAEDIKKFDSYLKDLITTAKIRLAHNSSDLQVYRNLLDGIFCSVMIFNRRRVGELQRMTLLGFLRNYDMIPSSEFEKALTNSEKILYQSLKRIVIRGKRGRGVPVLFDKNTVESIEYLISIRKNYDLVDNPFLFGLPGTINPITGYMVMRKHAKLALGDDQKASLLTSTKLRKQLATITQIFKMEKNELEQLASFMGHTGKTHTEYYRLPDDVYQTAKVSKLLLLTKEGALERFKGKRLEEIELDDQAIEENESDEDEDEYIPVLSKALEDNQNDSRKEEADGVENIKTTTGTSNIKIKKRAKRTLVPWNAEQKKLTEEFFKNHIQKKIPPKKQEVMTLIHKYPDIFHNKTWPTIKVFIFNKYKNN